MRPQNMASWHIKDLKLKEFLKSGRSRKVTLSSHPGSSSLTQVLKLPCEKYSPCSRREDILITRDGEFWAKKSVETNLFKLILIFLVTSLSLATPNPYPSVLSLLHKCIVSLSKRYNRFLLWSVQVFSLL